MRNRKLILSAVVALLVVTFNACIEDPEPAPLDVAADAFVQKTILNGEEMYAPAFWTLANKPLESVTVEAPDDETWQLEKDPGSSLVFSHFPETAQYTDSLPPSGDYVFTVASTQEGEAPITVVDKLEDSELGAVSIDSAQFVNAKLKITWAAVEDVDDYLVRLYDESNNLLFVSPSLANNKTEFTFGINDSGWADANDRAETGENYKVELLALLYESTSTTSNKNYNIQFISFDSKDIVWDE